MFSMRREDTESYRGRAKQLFLREMPEGPAGAEEASEEKVEEKEITQRAHSWEHRGHGEKKVRGAR